MSLIKRVDPSKFYVIGVISNPRRFESRYRLYRRFARRMVNWGAQLITVELAFGDRPFVITDPDNPFHVRVRTFSEIWHKENLINLGLARLAQIDPSWEYVGWLDCDIRFTDPWIDETLHALQHHMVVQPWSTCLDLDFYGNPIQVHKSFCSQYVSGKPYGPKYEFWHPGFAWAARREFFDQGIRQLMEFPILGSADHHMALALINKAEWSMPGNIHPSYKAKVMAWQALADKFIKQDIGYCDNIILHEFHGLKEARKYVERWDIIVKNQYNPDTDLIRDWQGVIELVEETPRQLKLRDDIRAYFKQRCEDSRP